MAIKIEKNVPFQEVSRSGELRNAMREMEIGDSFLIEKQYQSKVSSIGISLKPKKFQTRSVNDTQARVWRNA